MYGNWRETAPWLFNNFFMEEDKGGGGGGGAPPVVAEDNGTQEKTLPQSEVDRIVQGRVGETKRQTEEAISKQLGVSIEDAKKIIEAYQKQSDKDKTDAQLAREAADREKAEAETSKAEAAKVRHDAAVERALIRALPKDLEDDVLDAKVSRLGRLLDVEIGSSAEDIKKAVDSLKKDEPLLFGVADNKGGAPDSDIKGKPAPKKGSEDSFSKGQERAKTLTASTGYSFLGDKS